MKIILLLGILLPTSIFGQNRRDTIYSSDTMVIRMYKKNGKLSTEDSYLNGKLISSRLWAYYKESYEYAFIDFTVKKPRVAYRKEFYPDGKTRIETYYVKGKKHGKYKTWYSNGQPQCDCYFSHGRQDSLQTVHFDNGQIWTQRIFRKGRMWEVLANFDKSGNPLEKGTLKDGNGTAYIYDENANLLRIEYYENGKQKKVDKKKGR